MIALYHCHSIVAYCFSLKSLQAITGVDYDCPTSIDARIPPTWWLKHNSCKYMLACFVHKDNKDISAHATELPAGHDRAVTRVIKMNELAKERENARVEHRIKREQSDIVEHETKQAKLMECNLLLRRTDWKILCCKSEFYLKTKVYG